MAITNFDLLTHLDNKTIIILRAKKRLPVVINILLISHLLLSNLSALIPCVLSNFRCKLVQSNSSIKIIITSKVFNLFLAATAKPGFRYE